MNFRLALAGALLTSASHGAIAGEPEVLFAVAAVSDYVDAGVSASDESPAFQTDMVYAVGNGLVASLFASTVDFRDGDEATVELKPRIGFETALGEYALGGGVTYIFYPGAAENLDYDFFEVDAGLGRNFGAFKLAAAVAYAPEDSGGSGAATSFEGDVFVPFAVAADEAWNFGVFARGGHHLKTDSEDYQEFAVGGEVTVGRVTMFVSGHTNNLDKTACNGPCDDRIVAGLALGF